MRSESTLRRLARKQGLRLHKISAVSSVYDQYGPYLLADWNRGHLVAHGMDLRSVEVHLT